MDTNTAIRIVNALEAIERSLRKANRLKLIELESKIILGVSEGVQRYKELIADEAD